MVSREIMHHDLIISLSYYKTVTMYSLQSPLLDFGGGVNESGGGDGWMDLRQKRKDFELLGGDCGN